MIQFTLFKMPLTKKQVWDSISCSTIPDGKIRQPLVIDGRQCVVTGGRGGNKYHACELLLPSEFRGKPTTYLKKVCGRDHAERARNDPNGFYYGIQVSWRGQTYILGKEIEVEHDDDSQGKQVSL